MGRIRLIVLVTLSFLMAGCLLRGGSATLADLEVAYNEAQDAISQAESVGADEEVPDLIELAKNRLEEVREKQLAAPSQDVLREYRYVKTLAQRAVNQTLRNRVDKFSREISGLDEPSTDTVVYKVPASSDTEPFDREPVAYWSFDEDTGHRVADEVGKFNGQRVGFTNTGVGVKGRALILEGENGWVEVEKASSLTPRQKFTVSLWFHPTRRQKQHLINKGSIESPNNPSPFSLFLSRDGDIVFSVNTTQGKSQIRSVGYQLRRWHHVVASYNGTSIELYVNGEKVSGLPVESVLVANDRPIIIGADIYGRNVLQGRVDEVKFYDQGLDDSAVLELYNSSR